jgi:hypothetical protein
MPRLKRRPPAPAEHVVEVVTPRTNAARLSSAEHLFSTLLPRASGGPEPVSLEIVADSNQRRFLVRTTSLAGLRRTGTQLGAAYPQADLRRFHSATFPTGDPAQIGPDEQVRAATLRLRAGEHLPLRTFDDRELDAHGDSVQSDPLLGILGALADLPRGWRALCQLVVLAPAPHDWARTHQRLLGPRRRITCCSPCWCCPCLPPLQPSPSRGPAGPVCVRIGGRERLDFLFVQTLVE